MLMNSSPHKVMRVVFNFELDVSKRLQSLERFSRECLEFSPGYEAWQRSKDAFNERLFEQFLALGRQVNEFTSALEVLDHLEVELALDEFRGEF